MNVKTACKLHTWSMMVRGQTLIVFVYSVYIRYKLVIISSMISIKVHIMNTPQPSSLPVIPSQTNLIALSFNFTGNYWHPHVSLHCLHRIPKWIKVHTTNHHGPCAILSSPPRFPALWLLTPHSTTMPCYSWAPWGPWHFTLLPITGAQSNVRQLLPPRTQYPSFTPTDD